jgi:hypothetical protein
MASDDSTVRHWAFKGMKIAGGIGGALNIYLSLGEEFNYKISDFSIDPELSIPLAANSIQILEDLSEYSKNFANDFSRALIDDFRASLIRPKLQSLGISGRVQCGRKRRSR